MPSLRDAVAAKRVEGLGDAEGGGHLSDRTTDEGHWIIET